jgi:hypothetical protein
LSAARPDPKQARFIAGMKAPGMDPDALQRRLKDYLKHEARLDAIVRQPIFRAPVVKPKPQLDRLLRTYKPGRPAAFDESDARVLLTQVSDLVDEIGGAIGSFEQAEKVVAEQVALGSRDSLVFKNGQECLAYLSKSATQLKQTVKSVHMPKAGNKPELTVKEVYAAASVLITAAMVVAEVSRRFAKWHEQHKKMQ